jgi:hypothetical protein
MQHLSHFQKYSIYELTCGIWVTAKRVQFSRFGTVMPDSSHVNNPGLKMS